MTNWIFLSSLTATWLVVLVVAFVWLRRNRTGWIDAVEATNPLVAIANAHHHLSHEQVVLTAVENSGAQLVVVVERDRCEGHGGSAELVGPPGAPGEVAVLEDWCDSHVPVLLVDRDGEVASLVGPHRTVTGLHVRDDRARG